MLAEDPRTKFIFKLNRSGFRSTEKINACLSVAKLSMIDEGSLSYTCEIYRQELVAHW